MSIGWNASIRTVFSRSDEMDDSLVSVVGLTLPSTGPGSPLDITVDWGSSAEAGGSGPQPNPETVPPDSRTLRSYLDGTYTITATANFAGGGTVTEQINVVLAANASAPLLLNGTRLDDAMLGGSGNDSIAGLGGDDVLNGGNGNDLLVGGTGDDALRGEAGADQLDGGAGRDRLQGGEGADTLQGVWGADTLDGGEGADRMIGGTGNDVYFVDSAGDVLVEKGGAGIDTVFTTLASYALPRFLENLVLLDGALDARGSAFANSMMGNDAGNRLDGGTGRDTLDGAGGDDLLLGSWHADALLGGEGADTLDGGHGADMLTGGAGDDLFLFTAARDSTPTAPDEITDFVRGEDLIYLALDGLGGKLPFFVEGPFASRGLSFFWLEAAQDGDGVLVLANTDADLDPEFGLLVRGVTTLGFFDFFGAGVAA